MRLPLTGGFQCGVLRYEISQAPSLVYTCHCTDCQRHTSKRIFERLRDEHGGRQLVGDGTRTAPGESQLHSDLRP